MKTLLGILSLAFFCMGTSAQNPTLATQAVEMNLESSSEFYSWSAGSTRIDGSPYINEEFDLGMIFWNLNWHEEIKLRYNIYQGSFEAELERGIIVIDPIKNNIDTVKYRDEVFVKKYLNLDDAIQVVYLVLLGEQNGYALFKHYQMKINEAVTDTDLYNEARPAEYEALKPVYYVIKGTETWTVKGSKTLAEVYDVHPKMIKNFLKAKKYKLTNEDHLLETVLHFSGSSD
jgi:hypothetical protein